MGGLDVVVTGQAKAQAPSDKGMGLHPELSYTQAQLTRIAASLDSAPSVTDRSTWFTIQKAVPLP